MVSFTRSTRNEETISAETKYFLCEAAGVDPENPCDRSGFEDRVVGPILISLTSTLLGLLPAVNLIFTVNIAELKMLCTSRKLSRKQSTATISMKLQSAS